MAEPNLDIDVSQTSSGDAEGSVGEGELTASGILLEQYKTEKGYDLVAFNHHLAEKIKGGASVTPSVLFRALAMSTERNLILIADVVVQALVGIDALPQGYERTLVNLIVGLESNRLRALYDVLDEDERWPEDVA